eukprot:CAMPEP_0176446616 /NCGR_PEP_ID=MMETSP0127-20121128/24437_1 /TAXON_ID=938130 /ORGANISM="Platyophrya macrostoma, Strain WH" /LENGTH=242 /DNA_ID=CAMNT_0017832695 /DNA_START=40 /DNA_END=768 /DNA_ORIENTATION=-
MRRNCASAFIRRSLLMASTAATTGNLLTHSQRFNSSSFQQQQQQQQSDPNQQQQFRRRFKSEQEFHDSLPPCFDIVRWNEDPAKGYMLRVLYQENCVLLTYITQDQPLASSAPAAAPSSADVTPSSAAAGGSDGAAPQTRLSIRGKRVLTMYLPTIYIARFLAVLEGNLEKCDVASRQATGSFVALAEPHHFRLTVSGTIQNLENQDQTKKMEWITDLDAASSLMMQRFFSQALKYNSGFTK